MEKQIEILPSRKEYYNELLRIFNEGFSSKFRFVSEKKELQNSFSHDFGLINSDAVDRNFVAVSAEQVLGFISLRFHGQKKPKPDNHIPYQSLLKKYGCKGFYRALILNLVFSHKLKKDELYIENVAVAKESRGLGIGTRLLKFTEAFGREKGLKKLSLIVMSENLRAKALYEKHGYQVISSHFSSFIKKVTGFAGYHFMVRNLEV